jgi:hypothetical protein
MIYGMEEQIHLVAAGNTVVTAILLIRQMGYNVLVDKEKGRCSAEKDGNSFIADDPVMVLGLIKLFEMKGENWRASDDEIEEVMKELY